MHSLIQKVSQSVFVRFIKPGRTLQARFVRSHLILAFLGGAVALLSIGSLIFTKSIIQSLFVEAPTHFKQLFQLENEVQRSSSAIRAWISVEDEDLKLIRRNSWTTIENNLDYLKKSLTGTELRLLTQLSSQLRLLSEYQLSIEEIAHTKRNEPATVFYEDSVEPLLNSIQNSLVQLAAETDYGPKGIKHYFFSLQRSITSMDHSLVAYLHSGEDQQRLVFLGELQKILGEVGDMRKRGAGWEKLYKDFLQLSILGQEVLKLRSQPDWNIARHLLSEKCIPIVERITESMRVLSRNFGENVREQGEKAGEIFWIITLVVLFVYLLMGFVAYFLATGSSEALAMPIAQLSDCLLTLSRGKRPESLPKDDTKEFSNFIGSLNQLADSLDEREKRLLAVIESAPDAIFTLDGNGTIQQVNRAGADIFQMSREELLGQSMAQRLGLNTEQELSTPFDFETAAKKSKLPLELKGIRRGGESLPVSFSIGAYGIREKRYYTVVLRDISEKKRIESEMLEKQQEILAQNELQVKQLELSWKLRAGHTLKEVASSVLEFLARSFEAQMGALFFYQRKTGKLEMVAGYAYGDSLLQPIEYAIGEGLIGRVALEKSPLRVEDLAGDSHLIVSGLLGQVVPKTLLLLPILYSEEIVAVVELGSLKEISKEAEKVFGLVSNNISLALLSAASRDEVEKLLDKSVAQQAELLKVNDILGKQQRTLESQKQDLEKLNLKLVKSQREIGEKAEKVAQANRYKTDFLANMSHELRSPLNTILILSKILAKNSTHNLEPQQIETSETIWKAGRDLLNIINDIMDLSKVEAGKLDVFPCDVTVEEIGDDIKHLFTPQASEKGLSFSVEIEASCPKQLYTDPKRLEQILKNLVSNAIKFTEKGSVVLRFFNPEESLLKMRELPTRDCIGISVSDTGIGISQEQQERLFESFQQGDGSITRRFGGTGLGLAISRKMAARLGGVIWLESSLGEGSVFSVALPIRIVESQNTRKIFEETSEDLSRTTAPSVQSASQRVLEGKKIFIIDDDKKNIYAMEQLLRGTGVKISSCNDGFSALSLLSVRPEVDLFLVDMMMPQMSGVELIPRIREIPRYRETPIVGMTAMSMKIAREEVLSSGANDFVSKPMDADALMGLILGFAGENIRAVA